MVPPGIQLFKALYSPEAGNQFIPRKKAGISWKEYSTCALGHVGTCSTPWSTRAAALTSNEVQKRVGSTSCTGRAPGFGTGFIRRFKKSWIFFTLSLSLTCCCMALKPEKLDSADFA